MGVASSTDNRMEMGGAYHRLKMDRKSSTDHRMEIGGTSSADQQIMIQIHDSLRERLKMKKVLSPACCIYRVPERLRKLNENAYTPRVVSIGPIHHGKENLKAMEDHKIMYLQQFLEKSKVSVENLINIIKENETEIRDCYAEIINLNRKDFTTMILLDAVFIIMVLLNWKYVSDFYQSGRSDHIFFRPWKLTDVVFDMCLLENQLPFFILEKFFELSCVAANPEKCTIIELTCGLLKSRCVDWVKEDSWKIISSSKVEVLHFVDFQRNCQQPKHFLRKFQQPTEILRKYSTEETVMSGAAIEMKRHCPAKETAFLSPPTVTNRNSPVEETVMKIGTNSDSSAEEVIASSSIEMNRDIQAEKPAGSSIEMKWDIQPEEPIIADSYTEMKWDVPAEEPVIADSSIEMKWDISAEEPVIADSSIEMKWDIPAEETVIADSSIELKWDIPAEETVIADSSIEMNWDIPAEDRVVVDSSIKMNWDIPTVIADSSIEMNWDIPAEETVIANSSTEMRWDISSEETVIADSSIEMNWLIPAEETVIVGAAIKTQHRPAKETAFLSAPTATELHQSGVKFKHPEKSLLFDIRFSNGILEIPQLKIEDSTEILLRNLQAFEQCHHRYKDTFINDYISFINCLVRAPNDVEVLADNGILTNMLSSNKAVSNLFHNLNKENIATTDGFLSGVCEELNSHCTKRRHKWKATLKQEYFKNPWTGISVIAAIFLLILTVIQTVCSILQLG